MDILQHSPSVLLVSKMYGHSINNDQGLVV